ncbi:MAG: aldo/keto reductase [Saprospiraceae bacterium]|nr:aldo/keto reductase [Saprospiraceae bacterium]
MAPESQTTKRREFLQLSLALGAGLCLPITASAKVMFPNKEIHKRLIPGTKEALPIIGMGTWQTFDVGEGEDQRSNMRSILKAFHEMGGRVLDSSPMYGRSEDVLGDLAADLNLLGKFFMATKVWTQGRSRGIDQMNSSMSKMRTKPMDLMQVHNLVDVRTHLDTLRKWKDEGKIRYIGLTHYVVSAHDDLERLIKSEKDLDFIQINFSIGTRNAAQRLLPAAQDHGVGVLINRPYEGGSLFRKVKGKALPGWAKEGDINSWGQYFLKYIVSHESITAAIPATTKLHHLKDNMGAAYGRLPDVKTRKEMVTYLESL